MTPQDIVRRVVELLDSGRLPLHPSRRTSSGYGAGQKCAVCDELIDTDMRAIEAHGADGVVRHFHEDCYTVLVAERSRRGGATRRPSRP